MKCTDKADEEYIRYDRSLYAVKQRAVLTGVITALILIIAVLALINIRGVGNRDGRNIKVLVDGKEIAELNYDVVSALNSVEIEKTIRSGNFSDEEGVFKGVPLSDVLLYTYPTVMDHADSVTVKAIDGFTASYDINELNDGNNVILVYMKDGKVLESAENGGSGPFRIVVMDDPFGNRSVKYLCCIDIKEK